MVTSRAPVGSPMISDDMISKIMKSAGAGGIASGLFGLFGGGNNPYSGAAKFYNKIPGNLEKYLNPYITAGKGALDNLQGQYSSLLNDPGSLIARLGKGYTESPGFQFEKNQGLNSIENAASAGGMAGTAGHQQQAGSLSTNLANKDFNQYLDRAMGLYGTGLSGMEGINQMGYGASTDMAQALAQMLMNQGNLKFAGDASENAQRGSSISDIVSGITKFIPW